ncbi:MAG TPA: hypothetical protein VEZ72_14165 [Paenibacillus sp.]|nr:hypothetical protein [Paenibacillus sp.]
MKGIPAGRKLLEIATRRRGTLSLLIPIALAAAALILGFVRDPTDRSETVYSYRIERLSAEAQTIRVRLTIAGLAEGTSIRLISRDVAGFDAACTDDRGKKLECSFGNGVVDIRSDEADIVRFDYSVKLGEIAKHGHQGIYNDYLLAFSGEQALMLPLAAYAADEREVRRSIGRMIVEVDGREPWSTALVPFAEDTDAGTRTALDRPTTNDLLHLRKSAFVFGAFDRIATTKGRGSFDVYYLSDSDKYSQLRPSEGTLEGLNRMYDFYAALFGFDVPRMSVVLLPRGDREGAYTFAGADSLILASTFIDTYKRDWELMSHRMFHAFFDTKVTASRYRAAPNQWLYEGLATYYENVSMNALPAPLKAALGVDVAESFNTLYRQYVYMTLKDGTLLNFPPMEEGNIQHSHALSEFLHYTKAPLLVRAIEDRSFERTGERNPMLRAILEYPTGDKLKLDAVVHHALLEETNDFASRYLFGRELLPLWQHVYGVKENAGQVYLELNLIEHVLGSWFRLEKEGFPVEELDPDNAAAVAALAEKADAHFAPPELERLVRAMSPTVFHLLRQYALRAQVVGVDPSDPELRFKLLGDEEAVHKWEAFLQENGAEPLEKFGHNHE